jgi:hypothetical protein
MWKLNNLRTPEDGDNTLSKTSVRNSATQFKVSEDILHSLLLFNLSQDYAIRKAKENEGLELNSFYQ